MTLESFKTRVIAHALILELEGLTSDLETVIRWDAAWNRKWLDALDGRYDA